MRNIHVTAALACLVLSLGISGCTRVQQGATVGGAAGAGTGAIWASNAGILSTAEGALVGAATGGLVGALLGDQMEEQGNRRQLESELENLRSQLDAKTAMANQSAEENERMRKEIQRLRERIEELEEQLSEAEQMAEGAPREGDVRGAAEAGTGAMGIGLAQYTILERVLFSPGSATLRDQGKRALDKLAEDLKREYAGHELNIEGHTDDVPIQFSGWKSNWELGAARALAVLHYLVDNHGFKPGTLSATTFSQYRNIKPNTTEENRQQNRRAVIVVMPEQNPLPAKKIVE